LVQQIISFVESQSEDTGYGLVLLAVLVVTQLASYVLFQHLFYYQVMIGVRSTNCLIQLVYKKQLRVSPAVNKEFESGQVVNFVQVDADQLNSLCFNLTDLL